MRRCRSSASWPSVRSAKDWRSASNGAPPGPAPVTRWLSRREAGALAPGEAADDDTGTGACAAVGPACRRVRRPSTGREAASWSPSVVCAVDVVVVHLRDDSRRRPPQRPGWRHVPEGISSAGTSTPIWQVVDPEARGPRTAGRRGRGEAVGDDCGRAPLSLVQLCGVVVKALAECGSGRDSADTDRGHRGGERRAMAGCPTTPSPSSPGACSVKVSAQMRLPGQVDAAVPSPQGRST